MNKKTEILLEGTIMAALAMVLHFVPLNIGSSFTISLGQIPLTLFALRRGTKPALFAGLLWGMLYFVTGTAYILTPVQALIEYPIAFTFAGFAGLYHEPLMQAMHDHKDAKAKLAIKRVQRQIIFDFVERELYVGTEWPNIRNSINGRQAKLAEAICGHATDVIPTGGRSPERRDPLRFLCIQYLLKCNMSSSGREQLKT